MEPSSADAPPGEHEVRVELERMTFPDFLGQVVRAIGVALGLATLWVAEIGRDLLFRLLDRLNLRPRSRRRASAFPPGRPRRRASS
ncbi:MAG TPA: hypothetical protein VEJ86_09205 [Candidatus Binataceae bacterium]|nr:hypothetical protein [Candidatus Binataceae bacterium]